MMPRIMASQPWKPIVVPAVCCHPQMAQPMLTPSRANKAKLANAVFMTSRTLPSMDGYRTLAMRPKRAADNRDRWTFALVIFDATVASHRYYARPPGWQTLGCFAAGPAWYCP